MAFLYAEIFKAKLRILRIQIPVASINPTLAFTEQEQGPLEEPYFTINIALNFNH